MRFENFKIRDSAAVVTDTEMYEIASRYFSPRIIFDANVNCLEIKFEEMVEYAVNKNSLVELSLKFASVNFWQAHFNAIANSNFEYQISDIGFKVGDDNDYSWLDETEVPRTVDHHLIILFYGGSLIRVHAETAILSISKIEQSL